LYAIEAILKEAKAKAKGP